MCGVRGSDEKSEEYCQGKRREERDEVDGRGRRTPRSSSPVLRFHLTNVPSTFYRLPGKPVAFFSTIAAMLPRFFFLIVFVSSLCNILVVIPNITPSLYQDDRIMKSLFLIVD